MKKILLPTDFSANSRNAMEYAIALFGFNDVEYILLNVYAEPYSSADLLVSIDEILQRDSEAGLKKERSFIENKYKHASLNIKTLTKYGGLAFEVKLVTEEEDIDFIVMGTKGASGLKKVLIGSNTVDVIKKVTCPTLAIPEKAKYKPIKKIAMSTDYEELEKESVLNPLVYIAEKNASELFILNVRRDGSEVNYDEANEGFKIHSVLGEIPQQYLTRYNDDIVDCINDFVDEYKIDMLVLLARKHPFLEKLTHRSITNQMAFVTDVPLLVLNENATSVLELESKEASSSLHHRKSK